MASEILSINNSSCFSFIQEQKTPAAFLAALVFMAGAATAGIALAGYIPYHNLYIGIGVIAIDLVIISVLLATVFCHQKQETSASEQQAGLRSHSNIEDQDTDSVSEQQVESITEMQNESQEAEEASENDKNSTKQKDLSIVKEDLNDHWLPPEVWVKIYGYLKPNDLGQALFVSKYWNQLAKTECLWSKRIQKLGWRENQPDCFEAWRALHAFKSTSQPKCSLKKMHVVPWVSPAASGNQLVFCSSEAKSRKIVLWSLNKGNLTKKASRSFSHRVRVLGFENECIYGSDKKAGLTTEWSLISDSTKLIELNPQNDDYLVYKNNHIYVEHFNRLITITSHNVKTGITEVISQLSVDDIAFDTSLISNGVLFLQLESTPANPWYQRYQNRILRFDLDAKKWLPKLNLGQSFQLVTAIAGLVITRHKNNNNEVKIWDYR